MCLIAILNNATAVPYQRSTTILKRTFKFDLPSGCGQLWVSLVVNRLCGPVPEPVNSLHEVEVVFVDVISEVGMLSSTSVAPEAVDRVLQSSGTDVGLDKMC